MNERTLIEALSPVFPVISSIIREAADEFESFNNPLERRPVVDGAPAGIMLYALIWDRIERHFGYKGAIRVDESDGLKVLFFERIGVSVRVNKLDSITFSGPISRDPRKLHYHQQLYFSFYQEPPGHLIFGYTTRLNERGVSVLDRILLTLEGEYGVRWWMFIDGREQPAAVADQPAGPRPPVVRPKDTKRAPKTVDGKEEHAG